MSNPSSGMNRRSMFGMMAGHGRTDTRCWPVRRPAGSHYSPAE